MIRHREGDTIWTRFRPTNTKFATKTTLNALYGEISPGAIAKEIDYIHPHYRAMIEASPFLVLATSGPEGLDTSPRGDPAGLRACGR